MTNLAPSNLEIEPDATETILTRQAKARPSRRSRSALRQMLPTMTPWLAVGMALIGAIVLFGLLGPLFVGDPAAIRNIGLTAPSAEFPLGTTQTGQDVLAQLAYATRGSLQIGLIVGALATVFSAFFGILGAYIGGFADEAFSLISNVFLVIPGLPLVIVISGFVPAGCGRSPSCSRSRAGPDPRACCVPRRSRSAAATTSQRRGSQESAPGASSSSRSSRTSCRCSPRSSSSP
jgi:peptide/nickel transport system permease protein